MTSPEYHGGRRIRLETSEILEGNSPEPKVTMNEAQMVKVESMRMGIFNPLSGFNLREDVFSIMDHSTLPDGTPWSIPVLLPDIGNCGKDFREGDDVSLTYGGKTLAVMNIEERFIIDLERYCHSIFGTNSIDHPGVKKLREAGNHFLGGKIEIVSSAERFLRYPQIDPSLTRNEFMRLGFRTITGFQTRNPPHRGHEYLHKTSLKITDGLLLTPVVGQKKAGDFSDEQIVNGYEAYRSNYLPGERVILKPLNYVMEYAGPREALMHAIIRKNLGCTHFIIGRDHAGVGNFYGPYDAWKYVSGIDNLGIIPIFMNETFFCKVCSEIIDDTICPHSEKDRKRFSGTLVRSIFSDNRIPEPEIMRKEVYEAVNRLRIEKG